MTRDRFGLLEHHGFVEVVFEQHAQGGGYPFIWRIRLLVASPPVPDLLLRAKHLFVAAIAWQRCSIAAGAAPSRATSGPWPGTTGPGAGPNRRRLLYSYAPGRGAVHALNDYRGIVQCDGYAAYKTIAAAAPGRPTRCGCNFGCKLSGSSKGARSWLKACFIKSLAHLTALLRLPCNPSPGDATIS